MNRQYQFFSLLVLAFLFMPVFAFAGSYITPGTPAAVGGAQSTLTSTVLSLPVDAGRSYACQLIGSVPTSDMSMISGIPSLVGTSFRECGSITPSIAVSGNDTNANDNRWCFVAPETTVYGFVLASNVSGGEPARFECIETTIYGGYNTNANEFNFLELLNTTNATITAYVTAINFDGTTVIDATEWEIGPNNRVDVDLHTAAGANKFGLVYVSHNGPYGSIKGFVSQYRGPVSSLELATSLPLTPRDQNL